MVVLNLFHFFNFYNLLPIIAKKRPHFGKLYFEEDACNLELQTGNADTGETNKGKDKAKKIIPLTGK